MFTEPIIIIITTGYLSQISSITQILDPDVGGVSTFTVPLSTTGFFPATHWCCSAVLHDNLYVALTTLTDTDLLSWINSKAIEKNLEMVPNVEPRVDLQMFYDKTFDEVLTITGLQRIESNALP